ncbi:MAG: CAP domain-containing protein [Bacteroidia bacterium]
MQKLILFFTIFGLGVFFLPAQTLYRIGNQANIDHFLNNESGEMAASAIEPGWWSAQWEFIPVSDAKPADFYIVNHWTGCALTVQDNLLVCNEMNSEVKNQHWNLVLPDAKGYCGLMNVGTSRLLAEVGNKLNLLSVSKGNGGKWMVKSLEGKNFPTMTIIKEVTTTSVAPDKPPVLPPVVSNGETALTQAQINDFLNSHNAIRAEVGVAALTWNENIAAYATKWAEELAKKKGCKLDHRPNGKYGENLYQGGDELLAKPSEAVYFLAEEKKQYNRDVISDANMEAWHYTQIIWAKSTEIGCGLATCPTKKQVVVVCNYNPMGNITGDNPLDK